MTAETSRFVAYWRAADQRAELWFWCFIGASVLTAVSMVTTVRMMGKPREVIRIGCDGVPQLFTPTAQYSEPNEPEIRSFVTNFVTALARADSFSVVNDYVFAASKMAPKLREEFKREARGHDGRAGTIKIIESLRRRTQIDPSSLEVQINKKDYPWQVQINGVRQTVGDVSTQAQPFSVQLELVRASREEILEGMLVWALHSGGASVGAPIGVQ
jgi:hypothetical protein